MDEFSYEHSMLLQQQQAAAAAQRHYGNAGPDLGFYGGARGMPGQLAQHRFMQPQAGAAPQQQQQQQQPATRFKQLNIIDPHTGQLINHDRGAAAGYMGTPPANPLIGGGANAASSMGNQQMYGGANAELMSLINQQKQKQQLDAAAAAAAAAAGASSMNPNEFPMLGRGLGASAGPAGPANARATPLLANYNEDFPALPGQKLSDSDRGFAMAHYMQDNGLFGGMGSSSLMGSDGKSDSLYDFEIPSADLASTLTAADFYDHAAPQSSHDIGNISGHSGLAALGGEIVAPNGLDDPKNRSSAAVGAAPGAGVVGASDPKYKQPAKKLSTGDAQADVFGLLGLLRIVQQQNPDLNLLAFGADLTGLGLNLNSQETLSNNFMAPWPESHRKEPEFELPPCYRSTPPVSFPPQKIPLLSDEALFYIFYSSPRDLVQEAASMELQKREWRFLKDAKIWFQRVPGHESTKLPQGEKCFCTVFDPNTWEKVSKMLVIDYEHIEPFRHPGPQA
ncbi:CCR4-Not complex subunit not2 [Capsaspora owczarzaki ATCC 30864]|uniref:CCR4-Not complex subunit not2 n=1 Tax=Capsaspora owczarzaki (strain ATCC 30864) TaxID=595528 RepID=A0A0D2WU91_CAPO3|nr:CCR4-Not complex subunit not2 [Capsaspora owczarzaki ATCC 30864]KJE95443.1 CCR4-Not complex subunit not2 [Capsaspora owczarzaki ATCC 30864]|eukprot:XP_004345483.1 CCR4-Not complex subunit not2 [Capsaspora owczarzaki ATCC 30864]